MRSVIAIFLISFTWQAAAQTCSSLSLLEQLRLHSYVFLVEIVAARIEQSDGFRVHVPGSSSLEDITVSDVRRAPQYRRVRASVRVLEAYKGVDPPTEFAFGDLGHRPEVAVGAMYLVFANGPDVSMDCGGVQRISSTDPEGPQLLQELRSLRQ